MREKLCPWLISPAIRDLFFSVVVYLLARLRFLLPRIAFSLLTPFLFLRPCHYRSPPVATPLLLSYVRDLIETASVSRTGSLFAPADFGHRFRRTALSGTQVHAGELRDNNSDPDIEGKREMTEQFAWKAREGAEDGGERRRFRKNRSCDESPSRGERTRVRARVLRRATHLPATCIIVVGVASWPPRAALLAVIDSGMNAPSADR